MSEPVEPPVPESIGLPAGAERTVFVTGRFIKLAPDRVDLDAGEYLYREGEESEAVYLLIKGAVEVLRQGEDGREHRIGVVEAGRTVGEGPLLRGGKHASSARVAAPGAALVLTRTQFEALADEGHATQIEYLLLKMARNLAMHLEQGGEVTVGALDRELELLRSREATSTFLLMLLLGLCGYAVVMRVLTSGALVGDHSTLVTGPMMVVMALVAWQFTRRSGLPREVFGLTRSNLWGSARTGLLWTLPVLAALTGLRAVMIQTMPSLEGAALFPAFSEPFHAYSFIAYCVYALLTPLQEWMRSGALQGPLFSFLTGTERQRHLWSILLSNALFATTHLHLTLTYGAVAFVFGILWGAIFARTGSLAGPSVSHALVGVWGLYVLGFGALLQGFA